MSEEIDWAAMPDDRFHRRASVLRVVDGDTLDVDIDLGWSAWLEERLRLYGVDTPECRGPEREAGRYVTDVVARLFPRGTPIVLESVEFNQSGNIRGKFGRTLGVVYRVADGLCLNQHLVDQGLGWPTDRDGRILGVRDLTRLTGIS